MAKHGIERCAWLRSYFRSPSSSRTAYQLDAVLASTFRKLECLCWLDFSEEAKNRVRSHGPSAEFSNASVGCVDFALPAREACSHCLCVKIQVTRQQGAQRWSDSKLWSQRKKNCLWVLSHFARGTTCHILCCSSIRIVFSSITTCLSQATDSLRRKLDSPWWVFQPRCTWSIWSLVEL